MKLVAWMGNLGVCLEYCRVQEGRRVQQFLPFSFDLLRLRFGIGILAQDEILMDLTRAISLVIWLMVPV